MLFRLLVIEQVFPKHVCHGHGGFLQLGKEAFNRVGCGTSRGGREPHPGDAAPQEGELLDDLRQIEALPEAR